MTTSPTAPRLLRRVAVVAALAPVAMLVGCGDDSATAPATTTSAVSSAVSSVSKLVSPEAFEQRMAEPGVVTINVHVPNEGSIAGTDLTIPYTEVSTSTELPPDRSTPLAVYCRSGNMSADAVRDLAALGYTDIVELDGGFNAWKASGRPLQTP